MLYSLFPESTREFLQQCVQRPVIVMLFLGFAAGIPIFLIFSSLSLWLREAGVDRSTVTYFSWAVLGYSFKFVWAPLVDRLPIPVLTSLLGRRRAWLLLSQFTVIAAIFWMAMIDPSQGLQMMAIATVALGFTSATQDVVLDAFRVESAPAKLQALLSSTYIAGYRIGMIVAGAGGLYLADYFGSSQESYRYDAWRYTYFCMAGAMLIGVLTTLIVSEPEEVNGGHVESIYSDQAYLRFFFVFLASLCAFVSVFLVAPATPDFFSGYVQTLFSFLCNVMKLLLALMAAFIVAKLSMRAKLVDSQMVYEGYQAPVLDFWKRYGNLAIWVLLLIGFYRISDIVLGVIANVFYQDMGYSKSEIASVTKVFGVVMTICGSFLGGFLCVRLDVLRVLMLGAVLTAVTNLVFLWLANNDPTVANLSIVIAIDNLSQGVAIAAFVAWLSSLTNVSFTATQYALFSSLMTLFPKLLGGYSGTVVNAFGYDVFFVIASALGIPVIILIYYLRHLLASSSEMNTTRSDIKGESAVASEQNETYHKKQKKK